ncbi:uncharacterized protein LOC121055715 isoform X2 [Oryza brachyantha]|uniref:uncharacterized protein LOC121055715 isoform X2 n=1 Tax=Oryza brachyantha TaxID=4533 RepID=UPI001ADCCF73|nr:uncharacterized protein LOC121055715 isoform X2 [Oryza brachyantha]
MVAAVKKASCSSSNSGDPNIHKSRSRWPWTRGRPVRGGPGRDPEGRLVVTWPSLQLIACLAPEVLHWACQAMYSTSDSKRKGGLQAPLGRRIMEATGAKWLFPEGLRGNPIIG